MKAWVMRLLLGHRSLDKVIPHFQKLLAHPAESLVHRPIRIGPLRPYGLAIVFLLLTPILPFALRLDTLLGLHGTLDIALFTLGPLIALLIALLHRRYAMILDRDGVELQHGASVVYCPWDLFNVPGNAFAPEQGRGYSLVLPVASAVVARVELRRQGVCVATGRDIATQQLRFKTANEAVLYAPYETPAAELGDLLLRLGRMLGGQPVAEVPWVADELLEEKLPEAAAAPDGWLTIYLTRLPFPPICCDCGRTTQQRLPVEVARLDSMGRVKGLFGSPEVVRVPIPVCAACQRSYRRKWWRGCLLGLTGGLFVVTSLVLQVVFVEHIRLLSFEVLVMLMVLVTPLVPFLAYGIGSVCGGKPPVEVGSYWPRERAVTLRFARPGYAAQTLATARPG